MLTEGGELSWGASNSQTQGLKACEVLPLVHPEYYEEVV